MGNLIRLCLLLVAAILGCEDSTREESGEPVVDMGQGMPDVSVMVTPDIGENCVLVRGDAGEWVPQCVSLDQGPSIDASLPTLAVRIDMPSAEQTFSEQDRVAVAGVISSTNLDLDFVAVEVRVSGGEPMPVAFNRDSGGFVAELSNLTPGRHEVVLIARAAPDLEARANVFVNIECGIVNNFGSPLDPEMWKVLGSASVDERGWLEMTNNQVSTSGGIFLIGRTISPGSLDMSFRISAGAGACSVPERDCLDAGGQPREVADGFAVTFWNVGADDVDSLWELLCRCGSGANLSGATTNSIDPSQIPEGITIEFDMYPNWCSEWRGDRGWPNGFWDPTDQPHVEILQNGRFYASSPSLTPEERCYDSDFSALEGVTWASYPQLADNYWHDVHLSISEGRVVVTIDDVQVMDADLPEFRFKGGVLAFAGGSGAVSSFQRFDELSIRSSCQ